MDKQPSWRLGLPDAIGYINRNQWVLHQGHPRTDIAFYNKVSYTDPQLGTLYAGNDLIDAGYTYTYLNPANLNLSEAYISGNILSPEAPAYQALVITAQDNMTLAAVSRIQRFANAGLPIVLSGGLPGYFVSGNGSEKAAVMHAIHELSTSPNVHTASNGELAAKLSSLRVRPRVQVATSNNATWFPVLRTANSTDYVYIFNNGRTGTGYITVNSTKTPYVLNSWTGERSALLNYQIRGRTTRVPLNLAVNQTFVLAFTNHWKSEIATPPAHAIQLPSNAWGYHYSHTRGLDIQTVFSPHSKHSSLKLSSGRTYNLSTEGITSEFSLQNWKLIAEHWKAPQNMSDVKTVADKHNTTHYLNSLVSWLDIPGLQNASGVGHYSTQFTWPPAEPAGNGSADSAYLSFPPISHGIKLSVNGKAVPTLDFARPVVDLGPFIRHGRNEIMAVVPTLMWNYIRSIYSDLKISGSPPMLTTLPGNVDIGLIGEVKVVPYKTQHIPL